MIYITGDTHGMIDWEKLNTTEFPEQKDLTRDDYVIIVGDFGGVWDGAEQDRYILMTYSQRNFTTLFIDGNHENHRLLETLPEESWNGGRVRRAGERVLQLMRGEIYEVCGSKIFTFGGARTVSRYVEGVEGVDWWLGEEPSEEETVYGRRQLLAHMDEIDYVITHEAPLSARECIARPKRIDADYRLPAVLEEWLRLLDRSPRVKCWYFGHMHVDQEIPPRMRAVFNNVLELGTGRRIAWA